MLATGCGSPAAAQLASHVSLQSGYELRGVSLGGTRPVGDFDFTYDLPSGFYLNGSVFDGPPMHDRPALAGVVGDLGYALRLDSGLSLDGGVTRVEYFSVGPDGRRARATELYGGVATRRLSARIYYSPNYYRTGVETLYGELAGNIEAVAGIRLNAHLGLLDYLTGPLGARAPHTQIDWLAGASRQFGAVDVHISVSGGGQNARDLYPQPSATTAVIVGVGYTF